MDDPSLDRRADWLSRLRKVGTLLSLGLLAWLLFRQDWQAISRGASGLPPWNLAGAFALMLLAQLWNTARWSALLHAQAVQIPFSRKVQLVFAGLFASNFLPSTVGGDVVRIVGASSAGRNPVVAMASVLADRAIGVFGMSFVLPLSWPLLKGFLSGAAVPLFSSLASDSRLLVAARRGLQRLREALVLWARKPGSLLSALLASWTGVLCYLLAVLLVARGLGIDVTLVDVAGATGVTYFLTLIPISINGYGLRELGVLAVYTQLGATSEGASVLALITRALMLATSLPGAIWLRDLIREPSRGVLHRT